MAGKVPISVDFFSTYNANIFHTKNLTMHLANFTTVIQEETITLCPQFSMIYTLPRKLNFMTEKHYPLPRAFLFRAVTAIERKSVRGQLFSFSVVNYPHSQRHPKTRNTHCCCITALGSHAKGLKCIKINSSCKRYNPRI